MLWLFAIGFSLPWISIYNAYANIINFSYTLSRSLHLNLIRTNENEKERDRERASPNLYCQLTNVCNEQCIKSKYYIHPFCTSYSHCKPQRKVIRWSWRISNSDKFTVCKFHDSWYRYFELIVQTTDHRVWVFVKFIQANCWDHHQK